MYRFVLILILAFSATTGAMAETYLLNSGELTYTIDHPLKTAHGASKDPKGKLVCQPAGKNCEYLIAVAGKTFDSGNSNRDAHMRETIREATSPLISASGRIDAIEGMTKAANIQIDFAGKRATYETKTFKLTPTTQGFKIDAQLEIILSRHDIDRPSLLGASIKDIVPVSLHLDFVRAE